jgi:hypothetical protein
MGISAAVDVVGSALLDAGTAAAVDAGTAAAVDVGTAAAVDAGTAAAVDAGATAAGTAAADAGAGALGTAAAGGATDAAGAALIDTSTAAGVDAATAAEFGGSVGGTSAVMGAAPSTLPSLASILGVAKTASPIIGGLGQLAGGVGAMQAGRQSGQLAGQADPFSPYRSQYAAQLAQLMQDPNTVTKTPGYQFNLAQGLEAQQAQQASQGRLVSGGALLQSQQFGQQLAGQTYQQQLATLASLSGASQSPATGATAQGNLLAGQLGGTLGGAQAISSGLGTTLPALYDFYKAYNQPSPTPSA